MMKRLSMKAGIDPRLIDRLIEPISVPSETSLQNHMNEVNNIIERMETELSQCELTERNALSCSHPSTSEEFVSTSDALLPPPSNDLQSERIRIWEENRRRHVESERRILYPNSESLTHEIDIEKIVHRNQVAFSHNRHLIVPVMAEQTRVRYQTYIRLTRKQKKKQDRWNATHRDDDDSPSGRWKDDSDSKREKRSFPRTMARITRSQTSNMVECESLTSHDPAYFATRQADVSYRYRGSPRYKYVTHNAKLTLDGKPMKCQDLPRDLPCPPSCNCPFQVNEEGKRQRPWTDMEKFIFLNGFFNRPKDFRYIASTLTNRSVQDVVDFYYLYKRGMYTKLLLRVQLAMWKSMNYDARPLILAAAYGIGLPIPEEVLGPNYASYNLADFIHDDHVTILNSEQGLKPDDVILMHHPSYRYDVSQNAHVTPGILQERRAAREKRIEQLLMRMGLDLKHCIPTEEKAPEPPRVDHGAVSLMKEKLLRQLAESSDEETQTKRPRLDSVGGRKKGHVSVERCGDA
ncbi:hypothetical protein WA538_003584 [Blastocystis sp. DL]